MIIKPNLADSRLHEYIVQVMDYRTVFLCRKLHWYNYIFVKEHNEQEDYSQLSISMLYFR